MNPDDWAWARKNADLRVGDLVTSRRTNSQTWEVIELIPHDYRPGGMSVRVKRGNRTFVRDIVEVKRVDA